jgi:hypothetical protein
MQQLDYQQECGLIRYPFKDNASLVWTKSLLHGQLPNNILVDAALTVFDNTTGTIVLTSIEYDGSAWTFNFTGIADISVNVTDLGGIKTFSNRSGDMNKLLRLDVDTDALSDYFTINSLSSGSYLFDNSNSLCLSCYRFLSPKVTRTRFYNTGDSISTVIDIDEGGIVLVEGSNVGFSINGFTNTIDILAGNGTGLYDSCEFNTGEIVSINNTEPNSEGNFFLTTDSCYVNIPGINSIKVYNGCKAECSADTLINFAHYLNRVTDISTQLSVYADNSKTGYDELLAKYETLESAKTEPKNPYLLTQSTRQSNRTSHYHNITCGIYCPSKVPVNSKLEVYYSDSLEFVPDTGYVTIDNVKTVIPDLVLDAGKATIFSNKALECNSVSYAGFVLRQPIVANTPTPNIDIKFVLSTIDGVDVKVIGSTSLETNQTGFGFNCAYVLSEVGDHKIVTINVDLLNSQQPVSDTSVAITAPGYFETISSKLIQNGTTSSLVYKGFENVSLDYKNNNKYQVVLQCPISVTGDADIGIHCRSADQSSNKTLTISL